jgi:hypothetical protein
VESLEDRRLFSTLTVTSLQDSGGGTLRGQIAAAQSGDTIVFAPTLFSSTTTLSSPTLSASTKGNGGGKGHGKPTSPPPPPPNSTPNTIALTSGLNLAKDLTIQGPSTVQLIITANYASQIFAVAANTTVTVISVTITNGNTNGSGGAIFNQGSLTLNGCTVSASRASSFGGGIYNTGVLMLNGCTVSGSAAYSGGGIYNAGGTVTINNSTMSGNQARFGGALYNAGGQVTISGSTVSGNTAYHADYPWSGGDGGGIYNNACGTLIVKNASSIIGNISAWSEGLGPDVYNLGVLNLDSTSTIGLLEGNASSLL